MSMDEARNRDELTADSQKRAEIDAAFSAMTDDIAYQSEALTIAAEFSKTDWEAFRIGEDAGMP